MADIALALPLLWLFRAAYGDGKRKSLCPAVEKWVSAVVDVPEVKFFTGRTMFLKSTLKVYEVLAAAKLAKIDVIHVEVSLAETQTPEHLARNPHGKVPVLETDNGFIFESNAIMRYLARRN